MKIHKFFCCLNTPCCKSPQIKVYNSLWINFFDNMTLGQTSFKKVFILLSLFSWRKPFSSKLLAQATQCLRLCWGWKTMVPQAFNSFCVFVLFSTTGVIFRKLLRDVLERRVQLLLFGDCLQKRPSRTRVQRLTVSWIFVTVKFLWLTFQAPNSLFKM